MTNAPLSREAAEQAVEAVNEALKKGYRPKGQAGSGPGAVAKAADSLGIHPHTFNARLDVAWRSFRLVPDWSLYRAPQRMTSNHPAPAPPIQRVSNPEPIDPAPAPEIEEDDLVALLKRHPMTLDEIAGKYQISRGSALDRIDALQSGGINIHQFGDRWSIEKTQAPAYTFGELPTFTSEPDNTFRFGVMADSHLGSKYERLDALNDSYDKFAAEGISRVYHCGNWIEGEARFNRTDLAVHGMDAQLAYLAKHYPQRPGITTYAVTGDDHEGWYAQREGVDIGRRAEQTMREHGRTDWANLGFMEAHIKLVNANSGRSSILAVCHPGGGSSYAESYVIQKIIESLDGGEKPAVALYGHYHKCLAGNYRNVWWILVPSTKDQDIFMRKKRLRSVVGGGLIKLHQEPETGAITRCLPDLWQYFNKGYYNDRWSHSGDVVLPERSI